MLFCNTADEIWKIIMILPSKYKIVCDLRKYAEFFELLIFVMFRDIIFKEINCVLSISIP